MNIKAIINDWNMGLTHEQLIDKHKLTREQEFAITWCVDFSNIKPTVECLRKLKSGMMSWEIIAIMREET